MTAKDTVLPPNCSVTVTPLMRLEVDGIKAELEGPLARLMMAMFEHYRGRMLRSAILAAVSGEGKPFSRRGREASFEAHDWVEQLQLTLRQQGLELVFAPGKVTPDCYFMGLKAHTVAAKPARRRVLEGVK